MTMHDVLDAQWLSDNHNDESGWVMTTTTVKLSCK